MKYIKGHAAARARQAHSVSAENQRVTEAKQHRDQWEADYPNIPYGTCLCECGQFTPIAQVNNARYGHVRGAPKRYIRGHGSRGTGVPMLERCTYDEVTGCLVWQGGVTPAGYGHTSYLGKHDYVHRFVYEDQHGCIPSGMQVHHLCANRACQNAEHMQLVNSQEHGALSSGQRTRPNNNTKLTQAKARQIRSLAAEGYDRTDIARRFEVAYTTVSGIVNGGKWKE